jgi:hypothetical protein
MTLIIAAAMVLCWLVGILHPAMVGFIGSFLYAASGVDFDTAFHGFGTETPWFLYGALLLVGAADRSGLVRFVAARTPGAFLQSPLVPSLVLIVLAYALAFAVPSSLARATMLVVLALSWGGGVLLLAATYAASIFGHPDVAGGPLAIVGWDIAVALALLAAVAVGTSDLLRTPERRNLGTQKLRNPGTLELRLAAPVLVATALWVTSPLHGLAPALIGLACGLICLLPGIAPSGEQWLKPDHLAVIFAGAAVSIPAILIETKTVESLTSTWQEVNQSGGILPAGLTGYWSTIVYRMFSPDGARPALPPLSELLGSTAIWSYAGATLFSLHQSPGLILGMAAGGCRPRHVLMTGLFVLIAGSVVVMLF